jgi:hypothetical protein
VAVQVAHVRGGTQLRAWVDEETESIYLSVGPPPGQVLLGLTAHGASRLLDALQRELKVLDPTGFDCDDCLDTGQQWVPMSRGAASVRACHCPAASR